MHELITKQTTLPIFATATVRNDVVAFCAKTKEAKAIGTPHLHSSLFSSTGVGSPALAARAQVMKRSPGSGALGPPIKI